MATTSAQKGFLAITFLATLVVFASAVVNASFSFNPKNMFTLDNITPPNAKDYWNRSETLYSVRFGCAIGSTAALFLILAVALPVYYAAVKLAFTSNLPVISLYITLAAAALSLIGGWVLWSTPAPAYIDPEDLEQYDYWKPPAMIGEAGAQLAIAVVALGVGIAAVAKAQ